METNLISEIAHKVFMKNSKIPKELQRNKKSNVIPDRVTLTKESLNLQNNLSKVSEFEKGREIQIQRIKKLINDGSYDIKNEVVDKIAENIANMLL